jgi:flagellar hook protein FlgE
MGIFDALTTAVSGLQSQSFALQNISGNIANASTVGFKGIDTSFEDLIPDSSTPQAEVAGGVIAQSQQTITTQGTISASTVATNVAINGDGFFSVQMPTGITDGTPTFNGVVDYTRAGDFQVNASGFLVNGAGYFLMGETVDPKTGNPTGNVPTVLNFSNNFVPAQATTAIQYAANLPTVPVTEASPTAAAGTITAAGGLNASDFGVNNPTVVGTPPPPFVNTSDVGNAAVDNTGAAITSNTLLSNLSTSVTAATSPITVDGTVINFANGTPATPTGGTVGTLTGTANLSTGISDTGANQTFTIDGTTVTLTTGTGTGTGTAPMKNFTLANIVAAINGAGTDVTASAPGNNLVLTQNTPSTTAIAVGGADATTLFGVNPTTVTGAPTYTFTPTGSPPTISLSKNDTVGVLLAAVDQATGNTGTGSTASSVTGGEVTLNSGTAFTTNAAGTTTAIGLTVNGDPSSLFKTLGFTTTTSGLPSAIPSGGGSPGNGVVVGSDVTTFDNETISGGAITVFNSAGTPVNVQLRWALTGPGTWNLFYQSDPTATGGQTAWTNVGQNFTFNANGDLTSPAGGSITIPNVSVAGQSVGNLQLNFSSGALTQFASTGGTATVGEITQNGFAAGQLQSVAINNSGLVVGTFSNGQDIDLAEITLSHFNGTNFLQALNGEAYAATAQSGAAIQGASGTISGSSLEGSNTDIADQFTQLIVTQQAYSANTKVITTANDMIESLLNVLR